MVFNMVSRMSEKQPSLADFKEAMQKKIKLREEKYGTDDTIYNIPELRRHLKEEIIEWLEAIDSPNEGEECVDIANLAYFIWRRMF